MTNKAKPISFKADMVNAILEGRKTQTRRVIDMQDRPHPPMPPSGSVKKWWQQGHGNGGRGSRDRLFTPPYGLPGDYLWVRETWSMRSEWDHLPPSLIPEGEPVFYAAGGGKAGRTRPSIFMPRWASRIDLLVTDVRVERLQDISAGGVVKEGIPYPPEELTTDEQITNYLHAGFASLWDSINSKSHPWASNPWVWVIQFERVCRS